MLLIPYVLGSLSFATPKSKRVLMHVWRHMLLTLRFVDSLFFATPKSRRVLMGTKVGGEVHGEGQRKRKSARRRAWRVGNLFFGFYATPKSKRVFLSSDSCTCSKNPKLFAVLRPKNCRKRAYGATHKRHHQFSHFHGACWEEARRCPYASMWGSKWGDCLQMVPSNCALNHMLLPWVSEVI